MNTTTLAAKLLALATLTVADVADLNDWAINTLRDFCYEHGVNLPALLTEETTRIDTLGLDFSGYLKTRRDGSIYINRESRKAVYTYIVTRRECQRRRAAA